MIGSKNGQKITNQKPTPSTGKVIAPTKTTTVTKQGANSSSGTRGKFALVLFVRCL